MERSENQLMWAKHSYLSITLFLVVLWGGSCHAQKGEAPLIVFAAASTTDVVSEFAAELSDVDVRVSFGPSSALARQIIDGAPAGVFLSANVKWIRELERAGVVVGEPVLFAHNSVVCVTRSGSPLSQAGVLGPAALATALGAHDLVAIADEGVPVGEYTRQSLQGAGTWDALEPQLVGQLDARDCLRAVRGGHVVAGFVYATDAELGGVDVLFALASDSHAPVELWAVATQSSSQATAFLESLKGERAREILSEAGFIDPDRAP